ncbi:helix-turn-helix domain-containing protein [Photobacterium damselae]|uniref:helix-turn-helix domain-containing protein n=1 Tax=Photobacterium damselae TaxID=38293 RepID=UPI0040676095
MCELDNKIKKIIINSGLDYADIARKCGVERSTVGKWAKNGKISLQNFSRLCEIMNLDAEDILNLKRKPKTPSEKVELLNKKMCELSIDDPRIELINMLLSFDVKY